MSARTATPEPVIERILGTRMMAIMRGFTPEEAVRAGRALANGGARVLEVSLVDPLALRSIEQLREDLGSRYELFERAAADFLRSLDVTKGAR